MISHRKLLPWMLAVLAALASVSAECDLDCETSRDATLTDDNGDPLCIKEEADFSEHELPGGLVLPFLQVTSSDGGYHCQCSAGWTGLRCRRKFEVCSEVKTDDNHCYHGGECQTELYDGFGNPKPFCNCLHSKDRNGTRYLGKYCATPITKCADDTPFSDSTNFCLNDGTCKSEKSIDNVCDCGPSTHGPHCEISNADEANKCNLKCLNGGKCKEGFKDFKQAVLMFDQPSFFNEKDFEHCECPDGFSGHRCEIKMEAGEICGDKHACQHGGKCVVRENEDTGEMEGRCDCTEAKNKTHLFAGKHCQHVSTSFCSLNIKADNSLFCVNGGSCDDTNGKPGCVCPSGYTGNQCEIVVDGSEEVTEEIEKEAVCDLECGPGECRKGVKDLSYLQGFGSELAHIANETSENFEHCVCQTGFVGPRCEFKVEICGEGQHLCLHGSKCVDIGDKEACDCDQAFNSMTQFAGAFCQHEASEFCTEDGKPGTGGQRSKAFCVNGGTCKGKMKEGDKNPPGCNCRKGFEGVHCEFKTGSPFNPADNASTISGSSGDDQPLSTAGIVLVALASTAMVAVFAFFVFKKSRTGKQAPVDKSIGMPAPAPTAGVVLNMGPEKDADGNEVTDVEIL